MESKDLDKELVKLKRLNIPPPGEGAKDTALKAAMDEFEQQKEADKKNIKGLGLLGRLTGKFTRKGGTVMMTRRWIFDVAAVAAVCLIVVAITLPGYMERARQSGIDSNVLTGKAGKELPALTQTSPAVDTKHDMAKLEQPKESVPQSSPQKVTEQVQVSGHDDAYRSTVKDQTVTPTPAEGKGGASAPQPLVEAEESFAASDMAVSREMLREPSSGGMARTFEMKKAMAPGEGMPYNNIGTEYSGRDKFEHPGTSPVKVVKEEPVSTFSIDVDTASYAFMRRALNGGHLPQINSVRIEELINYFDYDYEVPRSRSKPFKPTVAVYPTPWNSATKLLHVGIKGHEIKPGKKQRSNLVFLIDVSGSMRSQDKLPLLKNSLRMLVDTLEPEDSVGIVVYAGAAGAVLEPTTIKEKGKILAALERLRSGGSTAGGEGIRKAYAMAEANFDKDAVNRVILATDGDFNVGIRNPEELKGFVERKRDTGVFLSVLGFGQGNYNDALMQKLAQNGNGNAFYIDTLSEARKVLVDEAGSTLYTIARDVKIQVEFNPEKVAEYRLIGYETRMLKREDFKNDKVDAGDVGAGHSVTAIYEITPTGSAARLVDDLRYQKQPEPEAKKSSTGEYAFLKMRYKLPGSDTSELLTMPIGKGEEYEAIKSVPGELRFAASVAAFGQLIRNEQYIKDFGYDDVLALAEPARGRDTFGYRSEFLNLVRLAKTASAMGRN
jgi:Ca-activated chloride channel family protein